MIQSAAELFDRLSAIKLGANVCRYTQEYCEDKWPLIQEIRRLKAQKNAIILAHSYVSPDIIVAVADFVGDSYELSKKAKESDADVIVFAAVKFMAETAKILSPNKTVIMPSLVNGCSLADSIDEKTVLDLRRQFPDHTFVCYINTSAEVKAACDVCVTSSNMTDIVSKIPNSRIYFLPDRLMGLNMIEELKERGIDKQIEIYHGTCYVHEAYDPEMIDGIKAQYGQNVSIASHPECSPKIAQKSDFVGSTSQLIKHVKQTQHDAYFLLTECGLSNRLQTEFPDKKFVGTCTMCKYMKSNTLELIVAALKNPDPKLLIELSAGCMDKAKRCIDAMFEYYEPKFVPKGEL